MCDYASFRAQAKAMFSDLIVSTSIATKGSGKAVEVDYYTVSVAGGAIGPDELSATASSASEAMRQVLNKVIPARRKLRAAFAQNDQTRRQAWRVAA